MADKKTLIDLALKAGRKRQSSQTGFVHYWQGNTQGEHHTIPLFENFCFVLALFRSRLSENIFEAKTLLEKLLKFQVGSHFPIYLHEYPECHNPYLGKQIGKILDRILTEFHPVLTQEFKELLYQHQEVLDKGEARPLRTPKTPEEWGEALAMSTVSIEEALFFWHAEFHVYLGDFQYFEKKEPALTLFDLYMGQLHGSFSKRALEDHPIHLRAALLDPKLLENPVLQCNNTPCFAGNTLFWGGREFVHSLYCHPKKSTLMRKDSSYFFHLSQEPPEEGEDRHEWAFYCPVHPDTELYVNGKKATTFQLQDELKIVSKELTLTFTFEILEGEGAFFGHIMRGNRPHQLMNNIFEAFDWQISVRTLSRSPTCTLRANIYCLDSGVERWAVESDSHSMHTVVDIDCSAGDSRSERG